MFNKKLTSLLRTFSRPELRQLEKFLASGLQVCPANGGKLVSLLIKHYPDFDEKMPDKTWFYKQLFPGKPYNDSRLRLLFSDTYAAARRFAVLCLLDVAPENEALLFTRYLQTGESQELLETEIGRAGKVLEQRKTKNGLHHYQQWLLDQTTHGIVSNRFIQSGREREGQADLANVIHSLNRAYLYQRLEYQIWRTAFLKEPLSDEITATYERICTTMPVIPEPLQILYKVAQLAVSLDNEVLLAELLDYFHSPKAETIDNKTLVSLFSVLHNSCLRLTWAGKSAYQFEQHRLIKRMIGRNQMIYEGRIHPITVCNFAQTCTLFGDVPFFETFYRQIEKRIPKTIRESTYHFCQAYLTFAKGDFTAALHHLQNITYDSYRRRLFFKVMLLRVYYERREHEALLSLADSVSHFLAGQSMLHEEEREYNNRFIRYLEKLVRLRYSPDEIQLTLFKNKLAEEPSANWRWLTAKADELAEELRQGRPVV